ncbi:hypothetical protein NM688_g152 [Phlebia brevispora]|uniref:Uncharacterized protein n=1 Tax=Phlebia brevispora TaxID=194682 RepID=A0ACC1TFA2_9APHY|nr:hypothetical protein NM688_g152 [Phlebia brevispora]
MAPNVLTILLVAAWTALISVQAAPSVNIRFLNAANAQQMNLAFESLNASQSCLNYEPSTACVNQELAKCVDGTWQLTACPSGQICVALPLTKTTGTTISCDTESDAVAQMVAAGANANITYNPFAPPIPLLSLIPTSDRIATAQPTEPPSVLSVLGWGTVSSLPTITAREAPEGLAKRERPEETPSVAFLPYLRHRRQADSALTSSVTSSTPFSTAESTAESSSVIDSSVLATSPAIATSREVIDTSVLPTSSAIVVPTAASDAPITSAVTVSTDATATAVASDDPIQTAPTTTAAPFEASATSAGDSGVTTVTTTATTTVTAVDISVLLITLTETVTPTAASDDPATFVPTATDAAGAVSDSSTVSEVPALSLSATIVTHLNTPSPAQPTSPPDVLSVIGTGIVSFLPTITQTTTSQTNIVLTRSFSGTPPPESSIPASDISILITQSVTLSASV